jgi:hypothetical protein
MALLRIEHKCGECNHPFILAIKPQDLQELSCCPFCASPIDFNEDASEDEAE